MSFIAKFLGLDNRFADLPDGMQGSDPLRREMYTREEINFKAQQLAELHRVRILLDRGRDIYRRFRENQRVIEAAYFEMSEAAQHRDSLIPGVEWLLDNYHVIQQNAREVKKDLPRSYYNKLPKLKRGDFRGYPRVFHLAYEFISHTDSKVDEGSISEFVESYQSRKPLMIGELWALPTMLRLVLIENMRRIVERWISVRVERQQADNLIEKLFSDPDHSGSEILLHLAKEIKGLSSLTPGSAAYMIRALRGKGPRASLAVGLLEEHLRESSYNLEDVLRKENQESASNQMTMVNLFTSFRVIGSLDWKIWVERASRVHDLLHRDPTGIYPTCDFRTRDFYRHRIEVLAARVHRPETAIAEEAINFAKQRGAGKGEIDSILGHVGYYLVAEGAGEFERHIGYTPKFTEFLGRKVRSRGLLLYLSGITLFTILALLIVVTSGSESRLTALIWSAILLFALIPASEIANSLVQWIISITLQPKPLPRIDFANGLSPKYRTVVAVHALFHDTESIDRAVEGLHVRYLANRDDNLLFALMADLPDADQETAPNDDSLISHATKLISAINQLEGDKGRFLLLFRDRKWNPSEQKWMGWERKRGKITELNRLIRGNGSTTFRFCVGKPEDFRAIRYVITLDLDTKLPRGTARQLIGTIAHPLNAPVVDKVTRQIKRGYGIIQPRVGISLDSAQSSDFARLYTPHSGIDPYTQCVSDVYQDLFSEGSFIGKAVFDVEAFEEVLGDKVPENSLLSHDLFEGNYARCGLASDIELFDDFPARYNSHAKRQHRWIRGDWQLLPWIFSRVPNASGGRSRSEISGIGRWKLFDNLRRSLVALSTLCLLLSSWIFAPELTPIVSGLVALAYCFPVLSTFIAVVRPPGEGFSLAGYISGFREDLLKSVLNSLTNLSFVPHQALSSLNAIFTTLYRIYLSKRSLLEWETAYHAEKRLGGGLLSFVYAMWPAQLVGILGLYFGGKSEPLNLPFVIPVSLLWVFSPMLAALLSRRREEDIPALKEQERAKLEDIAWETWCYFDELLNDENRWLIPDNIQLVPNEVIARRTSPTNISLSMLSTIGAVDLGFLPPSESLIRLRKVVDSLKTLERFNGHFLNWYGTERGEPLAPKYVSTVDSGNLVGHFITLKVAIEQLQAGCDNRELLKQSIHRLCNRIVSDQDLTLVLGRSIKEQISDRSKELVDSANFEEALAVLDSLPEILTPYRESHIIIGRLCRIVEIVRANRQFFLTGKLSDEDISRCGSISNDLSQFVNEMDFKFLFDPIRKLFSIGYNIDTGRRDPSYYDLLASEARLASLVAIAKGDVDEEHWFMLGRSLTDSPGGKALLSWSGTMFEYMMPNIVTRDYISTLLSRTYRAVIKTQQIYARIRKIPWGISESAYSGVDFERTYQYRAFGIPGLGLKRGLSEDLVVSPYSTFLSLQVAQGDALENINELEKFGLRGRYGFYEAIDFTSKRLGRGEENHIIKSFFAHHQGMSFISMVNSLREGIFQERFHSDPSIKATEILLQERFPRYFSSLVPHEAEQTLINFEEQIEAKKGWNIDKVTTAYTDLPKVQILSNGNYSVMVDNAGGGYSRYKGGIALTRWREDEILNDFGTFIYIKDRKSDHLWSTAYQPTRSAPEKYEVIFAPDKVEYIRKDGAISTLTEVVVSPEDDLEIRRVSLTNLSTTDHSLDVTSYGEVILGSIRGETAHPAFSNMFVESEYLADYDALLFSRRPRSAKEEPIYMFHMLLMNVVWDKTRFESSRFNFIGRGRSVHEPLALTGAALKGEVGAVLDPIFSLQARVELEPHSTQVVTFITGFAKTAEQAKHMIQRYHSNIHAVSRAFEMAWSQSSVELRAGQCSADDAAMFQRLANCLVVNFEAARGGSSAVTKNRLTQSGFWRFGISGDYPIVFVRITEPDQLKVVQQCLAAHDYLRQRGFVWDLVILNEYPGGYFQDFQHELEFMVRAGRGDQIVEKPGGVYLRTSQQLSADEVNLVEACARLIVRGSRGDLAEQIPVPKRLELPEVSFRRSYRAPAVTSVPEVASKLESFNGYGGFSASGRSYTLEVSESRRPPLPWSNVVASENFGFLVTESGGGFTWSENSRENRLTPWSNDPVSDRPGEVIYIRDVTNGVYWSATPSPCPSGNSYSVRHQIGSSVFETERGAIRSTLTLSGADKEPVKFYRLRVRNNSEETSAKIEAYLYCEWVLGVIREDSLRQHVTGFDPSSQVLTVTNNYNNEFAGRIAGIGSNLEVQSYTTSRFEFIGRHRDLSCPLALERGSNARGLSSLVGKGRVKLSGRVGACFNTCGVLQVEVSLEPGEEQEIVFFLTEARGVEELRSAAGRYRSPRSIEAITLPTEERWRALTGAFEVSTPNRSFDLLMNGWLLYQTVSCRLFGRSGFYQSGGAIGFRDQLQDSLALLPIEPGLVRKQILLHAEHQFTAGDVQHWWHPPTGRGVRTNMTDDLLWLPYAVSEYLKATGDDSILDEEVSFLEGPELDGTHSDMYFVPSISSHKGTIYSHCKLAIQRAMKFGPHGIPLIGGGDWNDGMNEVGPRGVGESVWLGWFLADVLDRFSSIMEMKNESGEANSYRQKQSEIISAVEKHGWDGGWYRRAFFDDGTPLGSASNQECRIDSLAQSWAIITGFGEKSRSKTAFDAVLENLVVQDPGVILLLTPPFDKAEPNPGYIKGYLPGVRENGAQYTHAATWVVLAAAMLGRGDQAMQLFGYLNPINHTSTNADSERYKGEPYVLCGDVYSSPQHLGRAGWSWYTGSSGWLFRVGLERLLGIQVTKDGIEIDPCVPSSWSNFSVKYHRGSTTYHINVSNPSGVQRGVRKISVNSSMIASSVVPFVSAGDVNVQVEMGD